LKISIKNQSSFRVVQSAIQYADPNQNQALLTTMWGNSLSKKIEDDMDQELDEEKEIEKVAQKQDEEMEEGKNLDAKKSTIMKN